MSRYIVNTERHGHTKHLEVVLHDGNDLRGTCVISKMIASLVFRVISLNQEDGRITYSDNQVTVFCTIQMRNFGR